MAWWEFTRFFTKGSLRVILSDNLNDNDLRGQDHIFVRLMIVVQRVGVELPVVWAHCVSIARCRRRGKGATTAGVDREEDSWKINFSNECVGHHRHTHITGKRQALQLRSMNEQEQNRALIHFGTVHDMEAIELRQLRENHVKDIWAERLNGLRRL